jgi:hypothetical protein
MRELYIEVNKTVPTILCKDIIQLFEIEPFENFKSRIKFENLVITPNKCFDFDNMYDIMCIPKHNSEWFNIERLVYKEVLTNIYKFRLKLTACINEKSITLLELLNNKLMSDSFKIQKYSPAESEIIINSFHKTYNRYNVLTFVIFLNTVEDAELVIDNKRINVDEGKLLIFFDELPFKFHLSTSQPMYLITSQLCYDNVLNITT